MKALTLYFKDNFLKIKKCIRKHELLLKVNKIAHFLHIVGTEEQSTQFVSTHFTQLPLAIIEFPKLVLHFLKHCPSLSS